MLNWLAKFFDTNERLLKSYRPLVEEINHLEPQIKKLKDAELTAKTKEFKLRLKKGESLDDILAEAFALVREAGRRELGLRMYDVQLMAAIAFHQGKVVEQKTGEGKTLSAVPALYLNSLTKKGCHLVTVNDYLARRDAGWMGPIFHLLGVSVGIIYSGKGEQPALLYDPEFEDNSQEDERLRHLKSVSRQEAYAADVTYGTNNEFGFDYLRDNMVIKLKDAVQRGHQFAIVDEVDSILIDEARTPLIISAPDTEPTDKYVRFSQLVNELSPDTDYIIDEKLKTANLTEHGILKVEKKLGVTNLYEKDFDTLHHIENALKAKTLYQQNKDYVVRENQVIIVDEFTGRLMYGRRWSEGLHQAVEAKEGVQIQQESRTLATISFQNYFRMYEKLAGMTGTAATEAEEFRKIYNLDVVVVPTNEPVIRKDYPDVVYKTTRAKYAALVKEIIKKHQKGQPVLIGTTSIEKNETVHEMLRRKKIPHQVLNAKNHEKEALIIANAGKKKAVTLATNIAGRGVDIVLGGMVPEDEKDKKAWGQWSKEHDEVIKLGGLHVIGTERHESRRIDNQLRGRSGRQGDPGSSRFYIALDDDIMRLFGGDQVAKLMSFFKLPENIPLEHGMVSKAIEQAQTKVEGFNFDMRKRVVEYDDVMNKQREIIYKRRRQVLELTETENEKKAKTLLKDKILSGLQADIENLVNLHAPEGFTDIEYEILVREFAIIIPFDTVSQKRLQKELERLADKEKIVTHLQVIVSKAYESREKQLGAQIMREIERFVTLTTIDRLWMDHLDAIDDLREGIGLRGYAQRDPLVEYKQEAFVLFEQLMNNIDYEINRRIFRIQVGIPKEKERQMPTNIVLGRQDIAADLAPQKTEGVSHSSSQQSGSNVKQSPVKPVVSGRKKIGRNDPCWCGSGKKWKKCHINSVPQNGEEKRLFDLYYSDHEQWEKEVKIKQGK